MRKELNQDFSDANNAETERAAIPRDQLENVFRINNSALYQHSTTTSVESAHFKKIAHALTDNLEYQSYFQTPDKIKTASTYIYENTNHQTCIFCDFTLRSEENARKHSIMLILSSENTQKTENDSWKPSFILIGKNSAIQNEHKEFEDMIFLDKVLCSPENNGIVKEARTSDDMNSMLNFAENTFSEMLQKSPDHLHVDDTQNLHATHIPFKDIEKIFQIKNKNVYSEHKNGSARGLNEILKYCSPSSFEHQANQDSIRKSTLYINKTNDLHAALLDYEYIENAEIKRRSVFCLYNMTTDDKKTLSTKATPVFLLVGDHKTINYNGAAKTMFGISEMSQIELDQDGTVFQTYIAPNKEEVIKGICYADDIFTASQSGETPAIEIISRMRLSEQAFEFGDPYERYEYIKNRTTDQLMEDMLRPYFSSEKQILDHSDSAFYMQHTLNIH